MNDARLNHGWQHGPWSVHAAFALLLLVGGARASELAADTVVADEVGVERLAAPEGASVTRVAVVTNLTLSGEFSAAAPAGFEWGIDSLQPLGDVPMGSFTSLPGDPASADTPAWWASRGVLGTNALCDYAAAVQGQVKWLALKAADELNAALPGGAGATVSNLLASFSATNNFLPVTLGQLKQTALPFYDRLFEEGYDSCCPWDYAESVNDLALANIGQVKLLFSFNPALDSDGDGLADMWESLHGLDPYSSDSDWDLMPDGWELQHGLDPLASWDAWDDPDGDYLSNYSEYWWGADPNNRDSDDDLIPDGWEGLWLSYFGCMDPTDPNDALADYDGDGADNAAEYALGGDYDSPWVVNLAFGIKIESSYDGSHEFFPGLRSAV